MAFVKPTIKETATDIKDLSIYLRSTKKFGKSTLFRDTIIAKYGDPSRGLLVGCGNEYGYKILGSLNSTQVSSWEDLVELKNWLIQEKGKEHNIEIIAFDTADELCLLADQRTIKISNRENPTKPVKSIKAAMGGYTAGEKYSANNLIKPFMTELQLAGFGIWAIAHTKMKSIKEKGSLEEDGYMQLTSNLSADYESAFGDIFDVTLTGVIDRTFDEKSDHGKTKKYTTDTIRKLYFRETPLIDAGGRFAYGSVPDYLVFDQPDMGQIFLETIEEGMKKTGESLFNKKTKTKTTAKSAPTPKKPAPTPVEDDIDLDDDEPTTEETVDEIDEPIGTEDKEALMTDIRASFKEADADTKAKVKKILKEQGSGKLDDRLPINVLVEISEILG